MMSVDWPCQEPISGDGRAGVALLMIMDRDDRLESWIDRQARHSALRMLMSISATGLRCERPGFGHVVIPAPGSVLASPIPAFWDPEPDYFFHWVRDSALVMSAVADLWETAATAPVKERCREQFEDFIRFSAALLRLDGAGPPQQRDYRRATTPEFRKFLRPEGELRALRGDRLLGEPRFNPDGTVDFYQWSRPQYDGPALRALACLRYAARCRAEGRPPPDELWTLLRCDLDFTAARADEPCIGPWEEAGEVEHHYYTAVAQLGAMVHGGTWMEAAGDSAAAARYGSVEATLRAGLDRHWSAAHQVYLAMRGCAAQSRDDGLDAAEVLAVLDAGLPSGRHSVADERVQATVAAIEDMFARELPINQGRPDGHAPALGRSRDDRYFGGGAWYVTTLGAACFHYRLADHLRGAAGAGDKARALIRRGDAFMATVRRFTPPDGSLSEQFDRATGEPRSARHLTWSYAAFVTAAGARKRALRAA